MDLRHLRYFVTIAEDLSLRRAAERLHLSHPTLRKQIGDLEDELGLKLFHRNPRRVKLTEVGRGLGQDTRWPGCSGLVSGLSVSHRPGYHPVFCYFLDRAEAPHWPLFACLLLLPKQFGSEYYNALI
jgi:hypothetical protein